MTLDHRQICTLLLERCAPAGFDLVQPLQVGWYNRAVDAAYRVPDLGDPRSLAIVIGNTRALWPPLCAAVAADAELNAAEHPVDRYTERAIDDALQVLSEPWEVRFSHEPPPRRVAMQALAQIAGLAYQAPSYLSVHPTFGPWIALRALVVVAVPGPPTKAPLTPPCDCDAHCSPTFRDAMAFFRDPARSSDDVDEHWRIWLKVRDACPVGRAHRYGTQQIRYHYSKDREALKPEPDS